jgi:hypothetical protein
MCFRSCELRAFSFWPSNIQNRDTGTGQAPGSFFAEALTSGYLSIAAIANSQKLTTKSSRLEAHSSPLKTPFARTS